jgi:transcriptional regulator with XRE-family HTH domain
MIGRDGNILYWDSIRLRAIMRRRGENQHSLARKLGVAQPMVCKWSNGITPLPENIQLLADVLGVKPGDFFCKHGTGQAAEATT